MLDFYPGLSTEAALVLVILEGLLVVPVFIAWIRSMNADDPPPD